MISNITESILQTWNAESREIGIFADAANCISRSEFLDILSSRCVALRPLFNTGDAVLIKAGRGYDFFIDMMAVWALGGVTVPLSADADPDQIQHIQTITEADCILDSDLPSLKDSKLPCSTESDKTISSLLYCGKGSNLAALFFTSGSTGKPKGVMLTHDALVRNCHGLLEVLQMKHDRLFVNIPFHFTSAICHFLACAFSGSTFFGIERKLFPSEFMEMLQANNCTGFGGAPVQIRWLSEYHKAMSQFPKPSPSALRFVMSSGDHLPPAVIHDLHVHLPQSNVFVVYGLTELAGRFCILDTKRHPDKIGSVGKPIRGLGLKVVDPDTSRSLGLLEKGEVIATGELLCLGYYSNPEKTALLLTPQGLRTGDIGHVDQDGFLYINGRSDDVFKVNGKKVSGLVITESLMASSFFADAAVRSENIDPFGVVPVALYVLPPDGRFNKGEVVAYLRTVLPPDHIPHRFIEVDSIPRTGSGKVDRSKLAQML